MYYNDFDMKTWRKNTVDAYRKYLERSDISQEEYRKIKKGIEELESIPL